MRLPDAIADLVNAPFWLCYDVHGELSLRCLICDEDIWIYPAGGCSLQVVARDATEHCRLTHAKAPQARELAGTTAIGPD